MRAGAALGSVLVVITLALIFNSPASKTVKFDIPCQRFQTPVALELNLNAAAQLALVNLHGFQGSVQNLSSITSPGVTQTPQSFSLKVIPNEASPSLIVTPQPPLGAISVTVNPNVTLAALASSPPKLTLDSATAQDIQLSLQSQSARLQGTVYAIPEIFNSPKVRDQFDLTVTGPPPGVSLTLSSGPHSTSNPIRADLTLNAAASTSQLLAEHAPASEFSNTPLTFVGSLKPGIEIEGKTPSDLVTEHRTTVNILPLHGHIISVSVIPGTAEKGAPALEVNGEAEVESLLQNGHELLPSRVQELLDQPYGKRTAWFVFLGFVAFVMFKVVDRAFEVLLKLVLPGG